MTTELLNKTKAILNKHNAFPQNIDMDTRLKLISVDASEYEYWGNKFIEGESCIINRAIALEFRHSMVETPFWIVFFHGGQYCSNEEILVRAFYSKPHMSDAIYKIDGINIDLDKKVDGLETILDIESKFDRHWISEDDSEMDPPILNDKPRAICELAEELVGILNIDINISIPLKNVTLDLIEDLEEKLEKAKEGYRGNEGKKLFNEIMKDVNCPDMLKQFVKKHSLNTVTFEKILENEDYMPDYGKYIVFENESTRFGFMFECTETYAENYSSFDGTEFQHDVHFAETLQEHELLMPEDEWTEEHTKQAIETWEFVTDFSNEGFERKLYS